MNVPPLFPEADASATPAPYHPGVQLIATRPPRCLLLRHPRMNTASRRTFVPAPKSVPPPYLRGSANRLADGWQQDRTLWVVFGPEAWREAKWRWAVQLVAIVPPCADPASYDWRLAARFPAPVMLVWTGEPGAGDLQADALANAMIRDGVLRVLGDHRIGDGLGERWLHPTEMAISHSVRGVGHAA